VAAGLPLCAHAQAPEDPKAAIAVMPLRTTTIDATAVRVLDNLLVAAVAEAVPYRVISPQDVSSMLGFDRLKQAVGCEELSCAADIAGALGSRFLLLTTFDALGTKLIVTTSLIDSRKVEVVRRISIEVTNNPDQYGEGVRKAVAKLFKSALDLDEKPPAITSDELTAQAMACLAKNTDACVTISEKKQTALRVVAQACGKGDKAACDAATKVPGDAGALELYDQCVGGMSRTCYALVQSGTVNRLGGGIGTILFWTGLPTAVVGAGLTTWGLIAGSKGNGWTVMAVIGGVVLAGGLASLITGAVMDGPEDEVKKRVESVYVAAAPALIGEDRHGLVWGLTVGGAF
jgi:hypothetical protein